jgi:simple sugar transport system substrate-binding protein
LKEAVMRKVFLVFLALIIGLSIFIMAMGDKTEEGEDVFEIVMVVKLEGVAWFDNMRLGIEEFNNTYEDVNAYQIGADTADPAAQVALIEDLIAKGVDAILVVPNDPESLVPAFKKANDAGILTFTHEASNQRQVSYDIEAFDNIAYGRHMMDIMADWFGGSGEWAAFVGHLTSTTHNEWVDGEEMQAKEKYPGLKMVTSRIEEQENQQIAYEKSLELLKTYPNLDGIMGSAMSTMPGAAKAIEDKGMIGKVAAFGTCLPSVAGDYIESGAAISMHFWVPADAGYVTALVAYKSLLGEEIGEGTNLERPGYKNITIQNNDAGVPIIYGQAWVDVNKDNLDDWKNPDGSYML